MTGALERRQLSLDVLAALVGPLSIAAITASELLAGVHRADAAARRRRREVFVAAVLRRLPVLPFDLSVALTHARLGATLERAGQQIGSYDLLVAATAMTHGYGVPTLNRRDFERVPGLTVRQPTW